MGECHPTRILRNEHALIIQVIGALERLVDRGRVGVSAGEARDFVDFFRLYTDALHHGKEEDLLFEAMAEHGFSKGSGPIAHMLEEHRLGRALVRQMAEGADTMDDHPAAWRTFENAARSYIELLRHHILKEDHALFDMADDAIDGPACRKLCEEYDTVCASRFEGRTRQDLERMGETLVARYQGHPRRP
jgi:hemerythrin-like domain-containing protein